MSRHPRLPHSLLETPRRSVCWRCQQRRDITQNYLARIERGKEQWAERAKEIRAGRRSSMLGVLEERGLVHAIAGDRKQVDKMLTDQRIGVYCGIDPTAQSLHIGHLVPMMVTFWMYVHGFEVMSLIGGSTAKIGDPTLRTSSRNQMTTTERKSNIVSLHYQIKKLWGNVEKISRKHGFQRDAHWKHGLVNNGTWWCNTTWTDVLQYMGKGFRLGTMLSRDTVRTKMERGDGMSFAEFCYPIMQAWDWWELNQQRNVHMQIGGEDQYGNIVAGIDAVNYALKHHPLPEIREQHAKEDFMRCGLTTPLITTASGEKLGKSAGNAVWLDQSLTSLFDLYRFLVSTADTDVERYLKLFTFLPIPEIRNIMEQHSQDPGRRVAQHTLAQEFIELIHGYEATKYAQYQHKKFMENTKNPSFSSLLGQNQVSATLQEDNVSREAPIGGSLPLHLRGDNDGAVLPSGDRKVNRNNPENFVSQRLNRFAPQNNPNDTTATTHVTLPKSMVDQQSMAKVLFSAGLVASRSEGHRLLENKGAYIGRRSSNREAMGDDLSFVPATLNDPGQTWRNVIKDRDLDFENPMDEKDEEGILILRTGKWKIRIIRIVSDKKFDTLGLPDPAGWSETKSVLAARRTTGKSMGEPTLRPLHPSSSSETWPEVFSPSAKPSRKDAETERRAGRFSAFKHFENEAPHKATPARPSSDRGRRALSTSTALSRAMFPWGEEKVPRRGSRPAYPDPQTQTHMPRYLRTSPANPAYRSSLSLDEERRVRRRKNAIVLGERAKANARVLENQREDQADRRKHELKQGLLRLRKLEQAKSERSQMTPDGDRESADAPHDSGGSKVC